MKQKIKESLTDTAYLIGGGIMTYGAWQIYQPAAYLFGGAFLIATAYLASLAHVPE